MEIIAKTNGSGVLIQATEQEVKEILNAVMGKTPDKIEIGQKIPAIDYASTIRKIQNLSQDSDYKNILYYSKNFIDSVNELKEKVESASKIEL